MLKIDIDNFIPPALQRRAADIVINFLSEQAKKYVDDRIAKALEKLHSNAAFHAKFKKSLEHGLDRFTQHYIYEDEDLVVAILDDDSLLSR